ncbi:MAG: DNA polymerase III subunit gamma/tau [Pseudomonadota bacterium]
MSDNDTASPAYRVLARKYRPATFDDLIGQEAMVRTLTNAFETGRIAQGYMLTGVRGVGKTTTARILARGLNFERADGTGAPTVNLNEEGVHCRAIIEGRHVDVQEMDAASHTGIDSIREINDAARYKPMSARYKVFVIDEVHMLSNAAFNGLLKTLEEPPEHVKFIFATTEIRKVPVTVLSRCQRFDLRRIDLPMLSDHLKKISKLEDMQLDDDAALMIARAAEGSVRDGLSLLDQAIAHQGTSGTITPNLVASMLGLADRTRIYDLIENLFAGETEHALANFHALYQAGSDPASLLAELLEGVHLATKAKVAPDSIKTAGLPEAERKRAEELAQKLSLRALTRSWQLLLKGMQEIQSAALPKQALDMLLVRVAHASALPTPDELIATLQNNPPAATARTPAPRGTPLRPAPRMEMARTDARGTASPAKALSPSVETEETAQLHLRSFEDLIALCTEKKDIPLRVALERGVHLVRFEQGKIELRLNDAAPATLLRDLQKKLADWTGQRWLIAVSSEAGASTLAESREEKKREITEGVRAHPAVQAVLEQFPGAKIVDVRIRDTAPQPPSFEDEERD